MCQVWFGGAPAFWKVCCARHRNRGQALCLINKLSTCVLLTSLFCRGYIPYELRGAAQYGKLGHLLLGHITLPA
jgi:hypothetical protein